jgi:hypothetical protein
MMKLKVLLILGLALCLMAPAALADTVDSTTVGAGWQTLTSLATLGTPYFNNTSDDDPNNGMNVGYFITGTGEYAAGGSQYPNNSPVLTDPYYWGMADGTADANFHFNKDCPGQDSLIVLTIAGNAGTNIFGYYDSTGEHTLFDGNSNTSTVTFVASGDYGYFLKTAAGDEWYTESSKNAVGEQDDQHFAVFTENGNTDDAVSPFYIAVEDLPFSTSDMDYNDLVVQATCSPVPVPPTLLLMGSGLLGLGGWRKFRKG